MDQPLISVIIAVYNAERTLRACIDSVLAQSYGNIELIIIDGDSMDKTLDIIASYSNRINYLISEKDNGIYDAMNKGIAVAKGDWLYFLGSDDELKDADVIRKIFGEQDTANYMFVYGNIRLRSNNVLLGGSRTYTQLIEKNISHQAIFYHKGIFIKTGPYDLAYRILADYDKNLQIFKDESIGKLFVPLDICLFNDKGGASNITIDSKFFSDKLQYFTTADHIPPGSPMLQQYNFYHGIVLLMRDKKWDGLSFCIRGMLSGKRKLFYCLLFCKLMLAYFGIGKKMKIV
jgi:glycosyltransferase involved in cell wall biosynthesis